MSTGGTVFSSTVNKALSNACSLEAMSGRKPKSSCESNIFRHGLDIRSDIFKMENVVLSFLVLLQIITGSINDTNAGTGDFKLFNIYLNNF